MVNVEYSWEDIKKQISSYTREQQSFYFFIKEVISNNKVTCINSINKLRKILLGLPCEDRYEIFQLIKKQEILNNFNAKEFVELYALFLPEDAYKFFKLDFTIHQLQSILTYEIDCEDIFSYFPCQNGIRGSVRDLFNTHLIQRQERNNLEPEDEGYDSNEDNSNRRLRI